MSSICCHVALCRAVCSNVSCCALLPCVFSLLFAVLQEVGRLEAADGVGAPMIGPVAQV